MEKVLLGLKCSKIGNTMEESERNSIPKIIDVTTISSDLQTSSSHEPSQLISIQVKEEHVSDYFTDDPEEGTDNCPLEPSESNGAVWKGVIGNILEPSIQLTIRVKDESVSDFNCDDPGEIMVAMPESVKISSSDIQGKRGKPRKDAMENIRSDSPTDFQSGPCESSIGRGGPMSESTTTSTGDLLRKVASDSYHKVDISCQNITKKKFRCSICLEKFASRHSVFKHKLLHTVKKTYSCTMCSREFGKEAEWTSHIRSHDSKPECFFPCSLCHKVYQRSGSLRRHEYRKHHGVLPGNAVVYPCSMCSLSFYLPAELKAHQNKHVSERLIACVRCAKSFKTKLTLRKHMLTHLHVNPSHGASDSSRPSSNVRRFQNVSVAENNTMEENPRTSLTNIDGFTTRRSDIQTYSSAESSELSIQVKEEPVSDDCYDDGPGDIGTDHSPSEPAEGNESDRQNVTGNILEPSIQLTIGLKVEPGQDYSSVDPEEITGVAIPEYSPSEPFDSRKSNGQCEVGNILEPSIQLAIQVKDQPELDFSCDGPRECMPKSVRISAVVDSMTVFPAKPCESSLLTSTGDFRRKRPAIPRRDATASRSSDVQIHPPSEPSEPSIQQTIPVKDEPALECSSSSSVKNDSQEGNAQRRKLRKRVRAVSYNNVSISHPQGLHAINKKRFICSSCKRSFSAWKTLIDHKRTHTGETPFLCTTCSREFHSVSALKSHVRTAHLQRIFPCKLCDKVFKCKNTLKQHKSVHTSA